MTRALLVHDDGQDAGLGHRRRMDGVARALAARRVDVRRASTAALDREQPADVLVVDSYVRRADEPDVRRLGTAVVAAVDDIERDLDIDVVIDPSPGADASCHRRARTVLSGWPYALVDLDPASAVALHDHVWRVVVTLGGDQPDAAPIAIELSELISAEIHVTAPVDAGSSPVGGRIIALTTTAGLASELASADLVVCAGGVTLLESLALGRPTVVVPIADNQRRAVDGVVAAGAAVLATLDDAASVAATLAEDPGRRHALGQVAVQLVDGRGAERVADALVAAAGAGHN